MRKVISLGIGLIAGTLGASPIAWAEIQPSNGPPGTVVTLRGGEFGKFQGTQVNRVEFNGVPALIQLWERDLILAKVPLRAQDGPVQVFVNSKELLPMGTFLVTQPKITRVDPPQAESGALLIIEGEQFGNTAGSQDPNAMFGANHVLINDLRAAVRTWQPNKIEVTIPANATSGPVTVRLASMDPLPDGSCCAPATYTVSNAMALTVIPPITMQPTDGPVGSKVVLSGQDFGGTKSQEDAIFFNGHPATIAGWSPRTIVVHVPLNATSGPLVMKRGDKERFIGHFMVQTSQVTEVTPRQGPIGTLLRIKGAHFGVYSESGATPYYMDFNHGDNVVEIGGVPAIIHRWQHDRIDVWVPFSVKSGPIVIKRGATVPNQDGTCCAQRSVVTTLAGSFSVVTPKIDSYFPIAAGLDEVVTIKGSGFGDFLKISEATQPGLHQKAHDSKNYQLGQNVSRTQVLINDIATQVLSWTDTEIQVRVPRRPIFGIGHPEGFKTELTKGNVLVQRGSWDMLPDGTCCGPKQWLSLVAGDFTILPRGLPTQDLFTEPNPNRGDAF